MNDVYKRAYTEVVEIISYFPEEEYRKIPKEKIEFYKNNMNKEYEFKINPTIDLSKQNISKEANAILVSIFKEYFANERQKEILNNLLIQNMKNLEKEKSDKYNIDYILKEKLEKRDISDTEQETGMIKYNEGFFEKFLSLIKRLLKKQ